MGLGAISTEKVFFTFDNKKAISIKSRNIFLILGPFDHLIISY
jgi:hypothetical protein